MSIGVGFGLSTASVLAASTAVVTVQRPTGPDGSPGFLGFVVTFAIAVVVVVLVLAMTTSLRRAKHRGEMEARNAAASEAQAQLHAPERRAVPREGTVDDGAPEQSTDPGTGAGPGPEPRD